MKFIYEKLAKINPQLCPLCFKLTLGFIFSLAFIIPLTILAIPFVPFLNGMAVQPKAKTQMTYGWIAYGNDLTLGPETEDRFSAERQAPEGVIPRGYHPYALAGILESEIHDPQAVKANQAARQAAKKAGQTWQPAPLRYLPNPTQANLAIQKRGQRIFNITCIVCHGKHGGGDGMVTTAHRGEVGFPAPPGWSAASLAALSDGHIFHLISEGRRIKNPKTGRIEVMMPSYAKQISREDRWAVIQYVRALQLSKDPSKVVK